MIDNMVTYAIFDVTAFVGYAIVAAPAVAAYWLLSSFRGETDMNKKCGPKKPKGK